MGSQLELGVDIKLRYQARRVQLNSCAHLLSDPLETCADTQDQIPQNPQSTLVRFNSITPSHFFLLL